MLKTDDSAPHRVTWRRSTGKSSRPAAEWRAIRAIWKREMVRFIRSRARIVLAMVQPLMFLLIFGTGLDKMIGGGAGAPDYMTFLYPGILVMTVQMTAVSAGASIVWDREVGLLREMLVAPVRRSSLLFGKCLAGASMAAIQGALMLSLAWSAKIPYHPVLLATLLVEITAIGMTLSALGAFLAVRISNMDTFQTVLSVGMMPLLFLSGTFFPVSELPLWLALLSLANPMTYAIDMVRRTVDAYVVSDNPTIPVTWGSWQPPVVLEIVILLVLGLVTLIGASRLFSRPT